MCSRRWRHDPAQYTKPQLESACAARSTHPPRVARRGGAGRSLRVALLVPFGLTIALGAAPAHAATFTVDRADDLPDNNPGNGQCSVGGGPPRCTLRAAIMEVNALGGGPHVINFNIAGAGVHTITPGAPGLPAIQVAVTIDATTQGGYAVGGLHPIELSGATAGAGAIGLDVGVGGAATIVGLTINRFGTAVRFNATAGNVVRGTYLGTNPTGTAAGPGNGVGAYIQTSNNQIDGTTAAGPNVVSGNTVDGIQITGAGATANVLRGNYIGLNAAGAAAIPNGGQGVAIFTLTANNVVGGTAAGQGNVISGNGNVGIAINDRATGNLVQGNYIGTDRTGTAAVANASRGVSFDQAATNNTVGGTVAGAGNVIAYNGGCGVCVLAAGTVGMAIEGNSIVGNVGLGIDLGADGVTSNDLGDVDAGPNNLLNFPVLSAAMTNGTQATFAGSYSGTAAVATLRIEFFASAAADPTGYGEGQRYLGFTNVTTNAAGNAVIAATLTPAVPLANGEFVTATATDAANDTSEFGNAIAAVDHLVVTTTADTVDGTTTSVANLIANPGADGRISLREAITATNANGGTNTITFGIPITDAGHVYYQDNGVAGTFGAPVATALADLASPSSPVITGYDADYPAGTARSWYLVTLATALPNITSPVVLDTTSQPLSVAGTGPVVELDGAAAAAGSYGLDLEEGSDGSTIRGFVINRFPVRAILIRGSSNNVVAGNFLGTNPAGTAPGPGNIGGGIRVGGTALTSKPTNNNRVGGTVPSDRNIISGNGVDGVNVAPNNPPNSNANNVVEGNYVGTDVTGTVAVGNAFNGIAVFNNGAGGACTNTVVGGTAAGAGNLISGNGRNGVLVRDPEITGTLVQGNKIGTNAAGTAALSNGQAGVLINATTSGNTIGGTAAGAGNVIAYNNSSNTAGLGGIAFAVGTGNSILGNSIYLNTGLGIDLNNDGVTPNAPPPRVGPNDLLNYPVITSASPSGGTVTVWFTLDLPAGSYRVEFFKNPSGADPSGFGEGQTLAGSTNLTHPGGGVRYFNASFAGAAGDVVTATTTYCSNGAACTLFGDTSEFAKAVTAFTTAVELMSFTATGRDRAVDLAWQTGSELDNLGFNLYRSASSSGPWTRLNSALIPGLGSSPLGAAYSWRDSGLVSGQRYYYRLEDVDTRSVSTFHGPVSAVAAVASAPPGGGDGSGGSGGSGGTGGSGAVPGTTSPSCPAWVRAASGSTSSLAPTCESYGDPSSTSLRVVAQSQRGAVLELETSGFVAVREASGGVRAFVPGFEFPSEASSPALPLRRALVEAVVGRGVRLESVEASSLESFPGLRPAAVGKAGMEFGADGTVTPSRRAASLHSASRGLVPGEVARLAGVVFQGEEKRVVVELSPLRFDASRSALVLARRVRVSLSFAGVEGAETGSGRLGRRIPGGGARFSEALAQLYTRRKGLHAVGFSDLFPGRRRAMEVSGLSLERQGTAVPFHVEPAGSEFGPGSVLYFYAEHESSSIEYSGETAYELVKSPVGQSMGVVGASTLGAPQALASTGSSSFETNRIYQPGLLEAPDPWLWDALWGGVSGSEGFTLSGVDGSSALPGRLVVYLQGGSDAEGVVDHHLRLCLNGVVVGETRFDGEVGTRFEAEVPGSLLREGANTLTVENVGDTGVYSLVFLDRFSVEYPQAPLAQGGRFEGTFVANGAAEVGGLGSGTNAVVVDVSGGSDGGALEGSGRLQRRGSGVEWLNGFEAAPSSVRFFARAGHRYLVASGEGLLRPRIVIPRPSSLKDPANQADFLVVAPEAFLPAAQALLDRRGGQGLVSRGVSFEEITTVFGHGQPSAEAIHDFLSYAYHSWARPSPRYVLLLGESTYDPQHFLSSSHASPLPALWVKTSYLWTVSDPTLAAVNGEDAYPDLAIGRLPATTVEEAEGMIAKVLDWEDTGQGLGGKAVLVADNPDEGGDFEADVQDIAQTLLAGRDTQEILVSQAGPSTRPAIFDAFDQGASLMSYVGHGGTQVWSSENVLNSWDASSLRQQGAQPLLMTMDCLNGYFVAPNVDALSEAFLKVAGRGAVASFAPSGLSVDGPAHLLHRALLEEIVSGRHERLGDAVLAAQKAYALAGANPELLAVYHLLGDPTLELR